MRLTEPSGKWPLVAVAIVTWTLLILHIGRQAGYEQAVEESEQVRLFVVGEMHDVGFCRWLEISDFASECAGRAALDAEGER